MLIYILHCKIFLEDFTPVFLDRPSPFEEIYMKKEERAESFVILKVKQLSRNYALFTMPHI